MNEREQYEQVCKGAFEHIAKKLDRIDTWLRGNGDPGLMTRMDRIEQVHRKSVKAFWTLFGAGTATVIGLVGTLVARLLHI
jgi:hypothetical protein